MTDKPKYMYEVNHLSRHADPVHFQVILGQLDDEAPGHHLNTAAAEALAMPPSKRGWREAIVRTRRSMLDQDPED